MALTGVGGDVDEIGSAVAAGDDDSLAVGREVGEICDLANFFLEQLLAVGGVPDFDVAAVAARHEPSACLVQSDPIHEVGVLRQSVLHHAGEGVDNVDFLVQTSGRYSFAVGEKCYGV